MPIKLQLCQQQQGQLTKMSTSHNVTLDIQGHRTREMYQINNAIALDNFTDLSDHIPSQADINRHPHKHGLRIPNHKRKKVDILICIGESCTVNSSQSGIPQHPDEFVCPFSNSP